MPAVPANATAGSPEMILWGMEAKKAQKKQEALEDNMKRAYALVYGQCSERLKSRLEGTTGFQAVKTSQDVVQLLLLIRGVVCQFDDQRQGVYALTQAKKRAYLFYQNFRMTNSDFYKEFKAVVEVVETYGGSFATEPGLIKEYYKKTPPTTADNPTSDEEKAMLSSVRGEVLAALFISAADNARYKTLKDELSNDYVKGVDNYPKTLDAALTLLNNYKVGGKKQLSVGYGGELAFAQADQSHDNDESTDEVAMAQKDKKRNIPGKRNDDGDVECYNCGAINDHIARDCPKEAKGGDEYMNAQTMDNDDDDRDDYSFHQSGRGGPIPKHWLLLDNQSTTNVIVGLQYLTGVKAVNRAVRIHCNAGSTSTNLRAKFGQLNVWYNPHGIANILSMAYLEKKGFRIMYDSAKEKAFVVVTPDGKNKLKFVQSPMGLHYLDLTSNESEAIALVNTVAKNLEGFTKKEVGDAAEARRAMGMMGSPSEADLKGVVRNNLLPNCPVTPTSLSNARKIYGPELAGIRGKTTRNKQQKVRTNYIAVPRDFIKLHKFVTLVADVMFIDGLPFLITMSRKIQFVTVQHCPRRRSSELAEGLKRVMQLYARGSFVVQTILMDGEFEKIRSKINNTILNTTAKNEHVSEIERKIRVMKERGRGVINTMPFQHLPTLVILEMVHFITLWQNAFPPKSGASRTLGPREIVGRQRLDYKKHCRAPFGAYCEAYDEPVPTNSMVTRTRPTIHLGPIANFQGSSKFMCLTTGRKIVRKQFIEMPMPRSVIKAVDSMALSQGRNGKQWNFLNRKQQPYDWDKEEIIAKPTRSESMEPFPNPYEDYPGIKLQDDEEMEPTENDDEVKQAELAKENAELNVPVPNHPIDLGHNQISQNEAAAIDAYLEPQNQNIKVKEEEPGLFVEGVPDEQEPNANEEEEEGQEDPPQTAGVNDRMASLRPNRASDFTHFFHACVHEEEFEEHATLAHYAEDHPDFDSDLLRIVLTQYSLKAGLKKFGKEGTKAVQKELKQMLKYEAFEPLKADQLTAEEKRNALGSLIFIKHKRDQSVKARACVDGQKQREIFKKEEAMSPTAAANAVAFTCAVDAHEKRDVATMDIPGAFLHATNEDYVIMKMEGKLALLMVEVDPENYAEFLTYENGTPTLYVRLRAAVYGMLKSALLFYKKLLSDLLSEGFELNLYDPCVVNKQINGKQMTIVWHVDDLKVSHVDPNEVTKFGEWLKTKYGDTVKIHRGKKHDYLGIDLDYRNDGEVKMSMIPFIKGIFADFPERLGAAVSSPATENLFKVRDDESAVKLDEVKKEQFHHTTAQLQFLGTKVRHDIQTAVSFLSTRVKSPDLDDWGKLRRVLKYLKGTRYLKLTISVDKLNVLSWHIDASHATHADCKGHTGIALSLGKGALVSVSRKQKINTRSSTETEIVGVDDGCPDVLWMRYFAESQGYEIEDNLVHQDNQSAMSLEVNGRLSSSKRTKHMKAKYFFIKDRIKDGELRVVYCPAEEMYADILTKPLVGILFRRFRAILMNVPEDYVDVPEPGEEYELEEDKKIRWEKPQIRVFNSSASPETVSLMPAQRSTRHPGQSSQECVGNQPAAAAYKPRTRQWPRARLWTADDQARRRKCQQSGQ